MSLNNKFVIVVKNKSPHLMLAPHAKFWCGGSPKVLKRCGDKINQNGGFSLLEVIMAIFVTLIGLGAVLVLITFTTSAAYQGSFRLVATNLAQEGIEVVRNIRDYRYSQDGTWDDWYADVNILGYKRVQYDSNSLLSFSDTFLNYNSGNRLYSYGAGSPTIYKRKITLTKITDVEIKVESRVTWTDRGRTREVMAEDRLWNWR